LTSPASPGTLAPRGCPNENDSHLDEGGQMRMILIWPRPPPHPAHPTRVPCARLPVNTYLYLCPKWEWESLRLRFALRHYVKLANANLAKAKLANAHIRVRVKNGRVGGRQYAT